MDKIMAKWSSDSLTFIDCVYRMETSIAQSHLHATHSGIPKFACNQNQDDDSKNQTVYSFYSMLNNGDYEGVLKSEVSSRLLNMQTPGDESTITDAIRENLTRYVEEYQQTPEEIERHFSVMCVGIASLQLFVQANWTGPPVTEQVKELVSDKLNLSIQNLGSIAKRALCPEGNSLYPLILMPELLFIARCILVDCNKYTSQCKTCTLWKLRCLWIQQQLLSERSPELYCIIMPLIKSVEEDEMIMNVEKDLSLPLMFHLECSHIYGFYYEYKLLSESLHKARKLSGLDIELTGALGKRTRYQKEDKAQLFLKIRRKDEGSGQESSHIESSTGIGLPKDLELDDDTVLNAIEFTKEGEGNIPSLTSLEQALVLSLQMEHKRTRPKDVLQVEELMAYIVAILRQPQCWSIQTLTLRNRCTLEKDRRRTVERAMTQMQILVDQFSSNICPVVDRMKLFYAVNFPPKWILEGELADLLMSLGCVSDALEIFVRLQLWENVVGCYKSLQQQEKAIHVIKEQLEIKESALMWCLLGDVTREKKYYEKAWEVSGQRSARAMSSLGTEYLHDEEYEKAIECLEASLEKNFLQYDTWFNLGYAAFKSEKYDVAAKAYRRCCQLESLDAQSWNNLATAYIRLNDKRKAFRTLKEAFKCNYDNWKIWDNFLGVCIDLGEFREAVQAYQTLLSMRPKHADEPVLEILVRAVTENMMDTDGKTAVDLKPKIVDLFDKVTSEVSNNATVWSLYGRLLGSCTSDNVIENDKALQCLQRAHRIVTQDQRWQKEIGTVNAVIQQTQTLVEAYENCSRSKTSNAQAIQLLSSAKLMLKLVISKIKQEHYDPVSPPTSWAEIGESVTQLETKLQELIERIAQLRAG